jgi:probable HAF family extracellular repeat protein
MHRLILASAAGFTLLTVSIFGHAQTYVYRLSKISKASNDHLSVNIYGLIAGRGRPCPTCLPQAFIWDNGQKVYLNESSPEPDQFLNSGGSDINNAGQTTGSAAIIDDDPANVIRRAFIWDGVNLQILGTLGGQSEGRAINASGQVTGVSETASGEHHAFVWDGIAMRDLGTPGETSVGLDINSAGHITGHSRLGTELSRAIVWDETGMQDLGTLGGSESEGIAINARDQVAGTSTTADGKPHAFLWERGVMMDLGTLGGCCSIAEAMNNSGQVVGFASLAADPPFHTTGLFLWDSGEMKDLRSIIAATDPLRPFVTLFDIEDINNLGQIVVRGRDSRINGIKSYFLSPAYEFTSFLSPTTNSVPVGSIVRIAVGLLDAVNVRIPDERARRLAGSRCRVQVQATGAQTLQTACMQYDLATNEFHFDWKLGSAGTGAATIEVRVKYGAPGPLQTIKTKAITITN